MLRDLETYIVQSGLDDMRVNADTITTVSMIQHTVLSESLGTHIQCKLFSSFALLANSYTGLYKGGAVGVLISGDLVVIIPPCLKYHAPHPW